MNPVQWFFVIGGAAFLIVALFLRELGGEASQIIALTCGLIGFFWMVPQLLFWFARRK